MCTTASDTTPDRSKRPGTTLDRANEGDQAVGPGHPEARALKVGRRAPRVLAAGLALVMLGGLAACASNDGASGSKAAVSGQMSEMITIVGTAENAKGGAVVEHYYLAGVGAWPVEVLGKRVRVQGVPRKGTDFPNGLPGPDEPPAAGRESFWELVDPVWLPVGE